MFKRLDVPLTDEQLKTLDEANASLTRLRDARVDTVDASSLPGHVIWAAESFIQLGLYRTVTLAEGMASEWN
ncbi:hypothetical protein JYT22_01030, partial [Endomicrobium sp. AH-315-J14]|nr:hypothetical protein [Endomicrobium sp. AH-315-J14]